MAHVSVQTGLNFARVLVPESTTHDTRDEQLDGSWTCKEVQ